MDPDQSLFVRIRILQRKAKKVRKTLFSAIILAENLIEFLSWTDVHVPKSKTQRYLGTLKTYFLASCDPY